MSQETLESVNPVESCENTFSVLHELVESIFRWLHLHCITELNSNSNQFIAIHINQYKRTQVQCFKIHFWINPKSPTRMNNNLIFIFDDQLNCLEYFSESKENEINVFNTIANSWKILFQSALFQMMARNACQNIIWPSVDLFKECVGECWQKGVKMR